MLSCRQTPAVQDAFMAGNATGGSRATEMNTGVWKLWTCNRCYRNNEARFDACQHCRSPAPIVANANVAPRAVSSNPFERYVARSGGRPRALPVATTRTPLGNANSRQGHANSISDGPEEDEELPLVEQNTAGFCVNSSFRERQHQNVAYSRTAYGATEKPAATNRFKRPAESGPGSARSMPAPLPPPTPGQVSIDPDAAKTWIYPINYPVREYQLQIVTQSLFKNTLVSLPTGLGKTLIAAVVMYNFYRWFPEGKVVFLAPTKPLVAQQISACYDIMGIPERDTAELQGSVAPEARRTLWDERRVFYCTPQSMANDIKHKRCNPGRFVCVVVDEAHRGTGNYAYVNVIREVAAATSHFRVLALSATPGSDLKTIQQVLLNLRISNIECRSEDDSEVARHTHARQVEVVKCKLGSHINAIRQGLVAVLQPMVNRMVNKAVLYTRDPMALKAWTVIQCLNKFRRTAHEHGRTGMAGEVEADMAILAKMVQAKDTLVTHGASGCLQKLAGMEFEISKRTRRTNAERGVLQHPEWAGLMKLLRQTAENSAGISTKHPKLIKLKEILREHFTRHQAAGKSTRAIVFTHLRDSVEEITEFLEDEELLRVKAFIGQGNSTSTKARAAAAAAAAAAGREEDEDEEGSEFPVPKQRLKGQTQKEQKAVVKAFFAGEFNCLVATCIAEEGLDIGEVDLIVSFDALNSPVRMVQRMGRTGRKRAGKVVVLVTEGAEESKLKNSNSKSKSITKALQARKDKFELFEENDPMVPPGPRPLMVKREMIIVEYHLSQVGGHQRKPGSRTGAGSGGSGGSRSGNSGSASGGGGSGDGSSEKEDWRLTPVQEATLAEVYSEEPGIKPYMADPGAGWKLQKSPWAMGKVERSARSKLLCEMRDFVAHQEWEVLYDPSDMQLAMANSSFRDDEDVRVPAALKEAIACVPDRPQTVAVGRRGNSLIGDRRRAPVEIGDSDDDEGLVINEVGCKPRPEPGADGSDRQQGSEGLKPKERRDGSCSKSLTGTKRRPNSDHRGESNSGITGPGGVRAKAGVGIRNDGRCDREGLAGAEDCKAADGEETCSISCPEVNGVGSNGDEMQSDPECLPRFASSHDTDVRPTESSEKDSPEPVPNPLVCEGSPPSANTSNTDSPLQQCSADALSTSNPSSSSCASPESISKAIAGGSRSGTSDDNSSSNKSGGAGAPQNKQARWECGCGCRMKAGSKRCIMCGHARPRGRFAALASAISGSGDDGGGAEDTSSSNSSRGVKTTAGELDDGCDGHGGILPSTSVAVLAGSPIACSTGGKVDSSGERWQCSCGSKYSVNRAKCRACGAPRPVTGSGGSPSDGNTTSPVLAPLANQIRGTAASNGGTKDTRLGNDIRTVAKGSLVEASRKTSPVSVDEEKSLEVTVSKAARSGEPKPGDLNEESCHSSLRPNLSTRGVIHHPSGGVGSRESKAQDASDGNSGSTMGARAPVAKLEGAERKVAQCMDDLSQDDGDESEDSSLADLFPSLHRFLAEETVEDSRQDATPVKIVPPRVIGCGDDGTLRPRNPLIASPPPPLRFHPLHRSTLSKAADGSSGRTSIQRVTSIDATSSPSNLESLIPSGHILAAAPASGSPGPVAEITSRALAHSPMLEGTPGDTTFTVEAGVSSARHFSSGLSSVEHESEALAGKSCGEGNLQVTTLEAAAERGNDEQHRGNEMEGIPDGMCGTPPKSMSNSSPPSSASSIRSTGTVKDSVHARQDTGHGAVRLRDSSLIACAQTAVTSRASSSVNDLARLESQSASDAVRLHDDLAADDCVLKEQAHEGAEEEEEWDDGAEEVGPPVDTDLEPFSPSASEHSQRSMGTVQRLLYHGASGAARRGEGTNGSSRIKRVGFNCRTDDRDKDAGHGYQGSFSGDNEAVEGENAPDSQAGEPVDEDDVPCGVCGDRHSGDEDPILLCDGENCPTAVHSDCYGVVEVPEGPWFCEPCAASVPSTTPRVLYASAAAAACATKKIACVLCQKSGGALKISRCGKWAHVVCVWWTPELVSDPDTVQPGHLSTLDPDRASLTCSCCHERGGAAVQCATPSCHEACHPYCGMRAGLLLREEDGNFELFCRTHSRHERIKEKADGSRRERRKSGSGSPLPPTAVRRIGVTGGDDEENGVEFDTHVNSCPLDRGNDDDGCVRAATATASSSKPKPALTNLRASRPSKSTPSPAVGHAKVFGKANGARNDEGREPALAESGLSQSPGPVVVKPNRRRKRPFYIDTDDDESDEEMKAAEECSNSGANQESAGGKGEVAKGAVNSGHCAKSRVSSDGSTPLQVFDMAPPPTQRRFQSLSSTPTKEADMKTRGPPTERTAMAAGLRVGAQQVSAFASPARGISAPRPLPGEGTSMASGDGSDDLVTLSQDVSPANVRGVQQDAKRRRLTKSVAHEDDALEGDSKGKNRTLGNDAEKEVASGAPSCKQKLGRDSAAEDGNDQAGGKAGQRRRCQDYDRARYRRFIEVEAEVDDEDASDDDEGELDTYYDSQDSFVNDGPMSYETSSSQDEDTPSSRQKTRCGSGGDGDGKKRRGNKRRFDNDNDEKGMYLQLLAQSQTPVRPRGKAGHRRSSHRIAQGSGSVGRGRGSGRFAFVNAIMRHAKDGGDPLDIEDACLTDSSYASTHQTPASSRRDDDTPAVEKLGIDSGGMRSPEERPRVPRFGDISDTEHESEAMYSQALKQTHPGSPVSPKLNISNPYSFSTARQSTKGDTKENDHGQRKAAAGAKHTEGSDQGARPGGRTVGSDRSSDASKVAPGADLPDIPKGSRDRNLGASSNASESEASGPRGEVRLVPKEAPEKGPPSTATSIGNRGAGALLTDEQRRKMLENREKALARLKQRQAAKAGESQVTGATERSSARAAVSTTDHGDGTGSVSSNGNNAANRGNSLSEGQFSRLEGILELGGSTKSPPPAAQSRPNRAGIASNPPSKGGLKRSRLSLSRNKSLSSQTPTSDRAERQQPPPAPTRSELGMGVGATNSPPNSKRHQATESVPEGQHDRVAVTGNDRLPQESGSQQAQHTTQQRERFRMKMTMDVDSEEESDDENLTIRNSRGGVSSASMRSAGKVCPATGDSGVAKTTAEPFSSKVVGLAEKVRSMNGTRSGQARATISSAPTSQRTAPCPAPRPGTPPAVEAGSATTIPLSAPRAGALEALSTELRSRSGLVVHASPLGGGQRDVDLVVGAQCAVCVRSRRKFLAQTHASTGSSPCRLSPSFSPSQSGRVNHSPGAAGGSADSAPPLAALLEASLQRYGRVVVIVEGLRGADSDVGDSGVEEKAAIAKVETFRGVTVVASRDWKETADKVVELVDGEARSGLGLPREVTGPLLSAAQAKFLSLLLRAPTLSYPGGLYLLQAFRGRSVKEVIASPAREFQVAVPGMTPQQAAKLKRFLTSSGASPSTRSRQGSSRGTAAR